MVPGPTTENVMPSFCALANANEKLGPPRPIESPKLDEDDVKLSLRLRDVSVPVLSVTALLPCSPPARPLDVIAPPMRFVLPVTLTVVPARESMPASAPVCHAGGMPAERPSERDFDPETPKPVMPLTGCSIAIVPQRCSNSRGAKNTV